MVDHLQLVLDGPELLPGVELQIALCVVRGARGTTHLLAEDEVRDGTPVLQGIDQQIHEVGVVVVVGLAMLLMIVRATFARRSGASGYFRALFGNNTKVPKR